jgi:hypothetical protein
MSDRRGLLINPPGCQARQLLVSGLFLSECFLEKANDLIMPMASAHATTVP